MPSPTTTGPGAVVLVVPTDVAEVILLLLLLTPPLLLVSTDVAVVDGGGGDDALEFPLPQPDTATRTSSRKHRHTTERWRGDVTDRFC